VHKRKASLVFALHALCCFSASTNAIEPTAPDTVLMKQLMHLQVQVNESSQGIAQSELTAAQFPLNRPTGLEKSLSLKSFNVPYDLYVWQQDGYLFAEAVPTTAAGIYVCSSSWLLVQAYSNYVSAFNSARFVAADGSTVCGDYSQSVVFQITQWANLYDKLVDFAKPFNMVENQNADLAVLVNGGVSDGSSSAGTISANLDINIPSIDLDTAEGKRKVWVNLIYNGNLNDGTLSWKLGNAGYHE